ncbi:hypothetical protein ZIOFF_055898 [Zingiber officinale]|uniref:Metallothionein-like protein n=1 Tax=Zingiber officinale TaxID=94328 RepID=A0A8J5FMX1_ZINOF|nr:hypothetical protein ZIOFF_055898 [Zingiber officinale]
MGFKVVLADLERVAEHIYGPPTNDSGLLYLQDDISVDESTLLQLIYHQGWFKMGDGREEARCCSLFLDLFGDGKVLDMFGDGREEEKCKMYPGLSEEKSTTVTMDLAPAHAKGAFEEGVSAGSENGGCKCGSNCTCDPCNCK